MDLTKIFELIKDPDLKIKISSLVSENLGLKEENFKLKKELEKAKNEKETQTKLLFKENHYYIKDNGVEDGPYCSNCWDDKKRLVRLHKNGPTNGVTFFDCPSCKTRTQTGHFIQPQYTHKSLY